MTKATEHIGVVGELRVTGASGIEPARTPLIAAHVIPETGNFGAHFRTQVPIKASPRQNASNLAPASAPDTDHRQTKRLWRSPEPTRYKHWRTVFEKVKFRLTGSRPHGERGERIEARPHAGIFSGQGDAQRLYNDPAGATETGIEPQSVKWSPAGSTTDDIAALLQDPRSEPHEVLKGFRANFPYVEVMPLPAQTRTIPLAEGVASEIIFPDLAVLVRIVSPAGVDIWYSIQGQARIPQPGDMGSGNVSIASEGQILNLDPTKYYYAKTLKGLSAISAVNTFVNVQAFINA